MRHVEPSWTSLLADGRRVNLVVTDRTHGDLAVGQDPAVVDRRRRAVVDSPWVWLHQVHGSDVITASEAGQGAGSRADAVVTRAEMAPIAVQVADCAPVAMLDQSGVIAVAHAGWRGILAGVLEKTVEQMAASGASDPAAVLGPCIGPEFYEFGERDLDRVAAQLGDTVRGCTSRGRPALDMAAAVAAALDRVGVEIVARVGGCTAAEQELRWSHRARGEVERQALVAWVEPK